MKMEKHPGLPICPHQQRPCGPVMFCSFFLVFKPNLQGRPQGLRDIEKADDGKSPGTSCKLLHDWWIILSRGTLDCRLRESFRDQVWLSHGYHICTRKKVGHLLGWPILRKMDGYGGGGEVDYFRRGLH